MMYRGLVNVTFDSMEYELKELLFFVLKKKLVLKERSNLIQLIIVSKTKLER